MPEQSILDRLTVIESLLRDQMLLKKDILNFNETALYLELSHSALYKLTSKKEIPHFCPNGKKLYFRRDEIDTWLQRNRQVTKDGTDYLADEYIVKKQYR